MCSHAYIYQQPVLDPPSAVAKKLPSALKACLKGASLGSVLEVERARVEENTC